MAWGMYRSLGPEAIRKKWSELPNGEGARLLREQEVQPIRIPTLWDLMDRGQRNACCMHYELSELFMKEHWREMTSWQKSCALRKSRFTESFIREHWTEIVPNIRSLSMNQHAMSQVPLELLPIFYGSCDPVVRAAGLRRADEIK